MHVQVSSFSTRSIILVGNFIIGESFVREFHVLEEQLLFTNAKNRKNADLTIIAAQNRRNHVFVSDASILGKGISSSFFSWVLVEPKNFCFHAMAIGSQISVVSQGWFLHRCDRYNLSYQSYDYTALHMIAVEIAKNLCQRSQTKRSLGTGFHVIPTIAEPCGQQRSYGNQP